jgi:hypothetical protein
MTTRTALREFWSGYEKTLSRIRTERPTTADAVATILNDFQPPSMGIAFFGNNADDSLADALRDAGWTIRFLENDYLWEASSPSGTWMHYTEGDVYSGRYRLPPGTGAVES